MSDIILSEHPQAVERAQAVIRRGGLVVFPTDTVYGLAADPFNRQAVARLFDVKGRAASKAIAVLVGGADQLNQVTQSLNEPANRLVAHYWPGALTIVVPRHPDLPAELSAYPTVGVRMPDHSFALNLLRSTGPLATTSANRSGGPNAVTAQEVQAQLGSAVDLILDGGPCPGGVPSTVVDCTGPDIRVLRQGAIPADEIERLFR